jgi:hypothetical protein
MAKIIKLNGKKGIERSMEKVNERLEARKKAGCDPFYASWQANLESMLVLMEKHLKPGEFLPMQIDNDEEWGFYLDIQKELDLPPDTIAILTTPSANQSISESLEKIPEYQSIKQGWPSASERNACSLIVSGYEDRTIVIHVSLPGIESVGIDVFEDGVQFGDYSYNTVDECLNNLSDVVWTYLSPKADWTKQQIIKYTEIWFAKGNDVGIENVKFHREYSYVHHPELIDTTLLEAVFKLVKMSVPKKYDDLDEMIEAFNDLNRDLELDEVVITKKGLLRDDLAQCQSFLNRIIVDMDMDLETLSFADVKRPYDDPEYNEVFDRTARGIYEITTRRACHERLRIN